MNCKGCNRLGWIEKWQFPFVGGKLQPKNMGANKEGDKGRPLNGRKVAFPCSRCNGLSQPKVIWVGPLFEAWLKSEEQKAEDPMGNAHESESCKLGFKEVVTNDIHSKI